MRIEVRDPEVAVAIAKLRQKHGWTAEQAMRAMVSAFVFFDNHAAAGIVVGKDGVVDWARFLADASGA